MIEKFHSFNRGENKKIIEEELEHEEVSKESLSFEAEIEEAVEDPITEKEKELLLASVSKPNDILGLPSHLRPEAIKRLKEKVSQKYFEIINVYKSIIEYIESNFEEGKLDGTELEKFINEKINGFDLSENEISRIKWMGRDFINNFQKIQKYKSTDPAELFKLFRRNVSFNVPADEFDVRITPFSVDFSFKEKESFRGFIKTSNFEDEQYKDTIGLSYVRSGVPVTSQINRPYIQIHEQQHKKFGYVKKISFPESFDDRNTFYTRLADEILAQFSEGGQSRYIFDALQSYKFWDIFDIDKDEHDGILRMAIDVINGLQHFELQTEEIIGLLSTVNIKGWRKVYSRVRKSFYWNEIFKVRKKARNKEYIVNHKNKVRDENEKLLGQINALKDKTILFKRRINEKGQLYEGVNSRHIIEFFRRNGIKIKSRNILLPDIIKVEGKHEIIITVGDQLVKFTLKILKQETNF